MEKITLASVKTMVEEAFTKILVGEIITIWKNDVKVFTGRVLTTGAAKLYADMVKELERECTEDDTIEIMHDQDHNIPQIL